MKRYRLFVLLVSIFIGQQNLNAQTDLFSVLDGYLSESEMSIINTSKNDVDRADRYMTTADGEEQKYSKFLNSDKKRKKKKGEKKTVPAKQNRVQAILAYNKAYKPVYELYAKKLSEAEFAFPDDAQKAIDLGNEANNLWEQSQGKYNTYKSTKKNNLVDVKANTLKTDVNNVRELQEDAIRKQVEALQLWVNQNEKKAQKDKADQNAWNDAKTNNTIASYNYYISKYPNGKYVNDAKDAIKRLEEQQRLAELEKQKGEWTKGLAYRVQILADKNQWSEMRIKSEKGYKLNDKIDERYVGGFYKYQVGVFRKYDDAKEFKKKTGMRGAFVVCFNNGNQINVKEAKKIEKNQ